MKPTTDTSADEQRARQQLRRLDEYVLEAIDRFFADVDVQHHPRAAYHMVFHQLLDTAGRFGRVLIDDLSEPSAPLIDKLDLVRLFLSTPDRLQ